VMPCTRYGTHEMPIGPVATRARELYLKFAEQCRV
jgi:branched-chain amino acid aminotransferase